MVTDSLASDPDGNDVEAAATDLEAAGYRLTAAYAYADAAILAARAGRASDAEQRAMALAAEIGLHPPLGPLPETRWLTPWPGSRDPDGKPAKVSDRGTSSAVETS